MRTAVPGITVLRDRRMPVFLGVLALWVMHVLLGLLFRRFALLGRTRTEQVPHRATRVMQAVSRMLVVRHFACRAELGASLQVVDGRRAVRVHQVRIRIRAARRRALRVPSGSFAWRTGLWILGHARLGGTAQTVVLHLSALLEHLGTELG